MARAKPAIGADGGLYESDFCLWVEEQVRLLRGGELERLDLVNLIEEIEDLGISRKHAVTRALVVVLKHLLKHQYQPRRRSRSWQSSMAEHRRRLRKEFQHAPSLRRYARAQFEECYRDGRRQALIETGLAPEALPSAPPYTLVVRIRQMTPRWLIAETTRTKGFVVRETPNGGNPPSGSNH